MGLIWYGVGVVKIRLKRWWKVGSVGGGPYKLNSFFYIYKFRVKAWPAPEIRLA